MPHRLLITIILAVLWIGASIVPTMAQDAEPTIEPVYYDPHCAVELMKAYISGWEYDHRGSEGSIDVVAAAQVARGVYKAFANLAIDCRNTLGGFKESLLSTMHGDYPPEDLARMLTFVDEAMGNFDYNDCSYSVTTQFLQRVDWGDSTAIEVGRAVSEIYRTVRDVIPSGACDGTFQIIQEIMSHIGDAPPDGSLIGTLYKVVGEATEGHYVSQYTCNYTLAKTFLSKVEWDEMTSADIAQLVGDTFKITYKISGDEDCDSNPALAITSMLLDDMYRVAPDASLIQQTYDAATGELLPTSEATAAS